MSASADSDQPAVAHLFSSVHATQQQQQQPASVSSSSSGSPSAFSLAAAPSSAASHSTRHLRVQPGLAATSRSPVAMELDSSDEKRSDSHNHFHDDDDGGGSGSSAGMRDGNSADAVATAAASASLSHIAQSTHNPSSSSSSLAHSSERSPPRSILKRSSGRKRSLRWDESNLAVNESEKVPRMKVDEPKTPYHAAHSSAAALSSMNDSTGAHDESGDERHGRSSFSSQQQRSAFDQQRVDAVSSTPLTRTTHTHTLTVRTSSALLETRHERQRAERARRSDLQRAVSPPYVPWDARSGATGCRSVQLTLCHHSFPALSCVRCFAVSCRCAVEFDCSRAAQRVGVGL